MRIYLYLLAGGVLFELFTPTSERVCVVPPPIERVPRLSPLLLAGEGFQSQVGLAIPALQPVNGGALESPLSRSTAEGGGEGG